MKHVIVNRWLGDDFEDQDCHCDDCGKVGTVYVFNVEGSMAIVKYRLCAQCLQDAITAINNAIMFAVQS